MQLFLIIGARNRAPDPGDVGGQQLTGCVLRQSADDRRRILEGREIGHLRLAQDLDAFLELGVDDGVIVARTDSLGAGLTKQIAVTKEIDDIGDKYNNFLDGDYIDDAHLQGVLDQLRGLGIAVTRFEVRVLTPFAFSKKYSSLSM